MTLNVIQDPSPNFSSRGGKNITHIVIHVTEGAWPGCVSWLKNKNNGELSAHYVIARTGEIHQLVNDSLKAWHACNANPFSIGIEHEGFIDDSEGKPIMDRKAIVTDAMWAASIALSAKLCKRYNIPVANILGHNDPWLRQFQNNHQDPGPVWDIPKYRSDVQAALVG